MPNPFAILGQGASLALDNGARSGATAGGSGFGDFNAFSKPTPWGLIVLVGLGGFILGRLL